MVRRFATEFNVVISHPGSSGLTGIAASLTGNTSGAYILDTTGTSDSLAPGGNTTLRISFRPRDDAPHRLPQVKAASEGKLKFSIEVDARIADNSAQFSTESPGSAVSRLVMLPGVGAYEVIPATPDTVRIRPKPGPIKGSGQNARRAGSKERKMRQFGSWQDLWRKIL